jgi:hypothetical protein
LHLGGRYLPERGRQVHERGIIDDQVDTARRGENVFRPPGYGVVVCYIYGLELMRRWPPGPQIL